MYLTHLSYKLKTAPDVRKVSFESWEEALSYLIEHDLQKILGEMPGLKETERAYFRENAAKNSKAEWFEFSHTEV